MGFWIVITLWIACCYFIIILIYTHKCYNSTVAIACVFSRCSHNFPIILLLLSYCFSSTYYSSIDLFACEVMLIRYYYLIPPATSIVTIFLPFSLVHCVALCLGLLACSFSYIHAWLLAGGLYASLFYFFYKKIWKWYLLKFLLLELVESCRFKYISSIGSLLYKHSSIKSTS